MLGANNPGDSAGTARPMTGINNYFGIRRDGASFSNDREESLKKMSRRASNPFRCGILLARNYRAARGRRVLTYVAHKNLRDH